MQKTQGTGVGFDTWVGKIPWRRKWQSTPVFLPGKSHGQRNLAGYGPWGHKESNRAELLEHAHLKNAFTVVSRLSSAQLSSSVASNSLRPHGLQYTRLPCPSPTPGACSNSYPLSQWSHPTISSSVIPFSSYLQSFPASGSFPVNQLLASGGQSTGASASAPVFPMNIQDWCPLELTGLAV